MKPAVQALYISGVLLLSIPPHVNAQTRTTRTAAQTKTVPAPDKQLLAVQVSLDRAGFSPGEIDGRGGPRTRLAVSEFQKSANLQPTGVVNEETLGALRVSAEPVVDYTITPQDVAGPFIDAVPTDMMESAKLQVLAYTSPLEALAEKFHASPALMTALNPTATWAAGETIKVPAVEPFEIPVKTEATGNKAAAGAKPAPDATPAPGQRGRQGQNQLASR